MLRKRGYVIDEEYKGKIDVKKVTNPDTGQEAWAIFDNGEMVSERYPDYYGEKRGPVTYFQDSGQAWTIAQLYKKKMNRRAGAQSKLKGAAKDAIRKFIIDALEDACMTFKELSKMSNGMYTEQQIAAQIKAMEKTGEVVTRESRRYDSYSNRAGLFGGNISCLRKFKKVHLPGWKP